MDSLFTIHGENWEEYKPKEETQEVEEAEPVEAQETAVDPKETDEEIDLAELTNRQLEELAKEQGIELTTADKKNKDTRIAAIVKAFE